MSEIINKKPSSDELKIELLDSASSQQIIRILKLHADSIAQRRNAANRKIYSNPICLAALLILVGIILAQYEIKANLGTVVLLISGLINAWLLAGSRPSQVFINLASKVSTSLVDNSAIFVIDYKNSIIGALTLRDNDGKVTLPIWTVERRYRNVGLGSDLLDHALQYILTNLANCKNVSIDVLSLDLDAKKLLSDRGFKLIKQTPISKALSFFGIKNETYQLII